MAQTLKEAWINNLREFTQLIEEKMDSAASELWYRGCGKATYDLRPTLFRHPRVCDSRDLITLESDILSRFKQRSVPYLERQPTSDWDYLFLMQHFRVPTRLLDWTENPYIALYFAVTSADWSVVAGDRSYMENAAVWILNPSKWNQAALQHIGFMGGILSLPSNVLKGYEPGSNYDFMNNEPVALYGTHNNPRIVAQRGVFTIFGKNSKPMEVTYSEASFPEDSLFKVVLPTTSLPTLLKSAVSIGYTDSVVFPDLEGLAKEIRRHFGYWV